jgi:hypothetical protein
MPNLITQNSKMKKSSKKKIRVVNFGIPAYKSEDGSLICTGAADCISGCFGDQGAYNWGSTISAYEWRYRQTKLPSFTADYSKALAPKVKTCERKQESLYNRVHDIGDYYSLAYWLKWDAIIRSFPSVTFYSYTKNIPMFKRLEREGKLPTNFIVIYSLGGKYDFLIDQVNDRHSRVFETVNDLRRAGYIDASSDDLKAIGKTKKVGLVYHGAKKFENTGWSTACAA